MRVSLLQLSRLKCCSEKLWKLKMARGNTRSKPAVDTRDVRQRAQVRIAQVTHVSSPPSSLFLLLSRPSSICVLNSQCFPSSSHLFSISFFVTYSSFYPHIVLFGFFFVFFSISFLFHNFLFLYLYSFISFFPLSLYSSVYSEIPFHTL